MRPIVLSASILATWTVASSGTPPVEKAPWFSKDAYQVTGGTAAPVRRGRELEDSDALARQKATEYCEKMNRVMEVNDGIFSLGSGMTLIFSCMAGKRCGGVTVHEVRSLTQLPTQLRRPLAARTMQRFTLAAVGKTCAVVAMEYGGIAHGFELIEYRLDTGGWRFKGEATVSHEPASLADLLARHPDP